MKVFFSILLLMMSCGVFAQSSKKKKNENSQQQGVATSRDPYYQPKTFEPQKQTKKSKSGSVTYDAERKYYQRVETVAKARRKAEKEMEKPQYSDPSYFGHKRPPKKRPPHKMKFCKECGIRH